MDSQIQRSNFGALIRSAYWAKRLAERGRLAVESARESARLRLRQIMSMRPVVLILATIIVATFSIMAPWWQVCAWMVPLAIVWFFAPVACKKLLTRIEQGNEHEIVLAQRSLLILAICNALIVGSGVWWLGLGLPDEKILFLVTLLQSMYAVTALVNASSHFPTSAVSTSINLMSAATYWFHTGWNGAPIGFALVGLLVLLLRLSRQIKQAFDAAVSARYENQCLQAELAVEKQHAASAKRLEQEKQNAEAALRQAEQANLMKTRFLAAASHDLRQPLHALVLFSGLLDTASAEQRQIFVQHIRHSADSLNRLFGGLLDLSRLDAGAVQANWVATRVKPLVENIVSEYQPKAAAKQLALLLDVDDAVAVTDPFLIERVLRNLVDNAIKYTAAGSVTVSAKRKDHEVRVAITDTGIGIREQDQPFVFDEFYQLHNPSRDSEKGAGLGLSIVRRLCDLLDHRLILDSKPGLGTTIAVSMPMGRLAQPTISDAPTMAESTESLRGMAVVVIEDDSRGRIAMKSLLDAWGCIPLVYESAAEAVSALQAEEMSPDVLITDFRLADGLNGFDAIISLRQLFTDLPASIITGESEANWTPTSALPEVPVFQKPVSADVLANWLASVR
ncbi:signal transduction histidine kinase [Chitinivorax tropicus]|uniref:histidine kinase n=1 Tax=Chitinivorax tropicus TaxID=714531 RepID=A0A840MM16_9PROT|nr:hybrid sensor histidine kinase/response regulator [Chitinivorax tropicus]MBB5017957.1 signal transduction histidine kinase [Chitinivorax tropicus]